MLLSAVSVLVVALSSLEIPEWLMNNPVYLVVQLLLASKECVWCMQFVCLFVCLIN